MVLSSDAPLCRKLSPRAKEILKIFFGLPLTFHQALCYNTCIDASGVIAGGFIEAGCFGPSGISITSGVEEFSSFGAQFFGPAGVCFCADGRWVRLANERAMEIRGPIGANILLSLETL